jgi:hypothetical protein
VWEFYRGIWELVIARRARVGAVESHPNAAQNAALGWGTLAVASIYGLVKCFGPKNCHASVDASTLTALLSEPGLERQSGMNLCKEFDEMQAESKNHQMVLD